MMGAHLNELMRQGVTSLASFVPWQAVESDIAHTLPRFLQAVADRKMTVSLILTPEVAVHYPNSGLPKDLVAKNEEHARHSQNGPVVISLPPRSYALPSLSSPEFSKRYHNFLTRMDGIFSNIAKNHPQVINHITVSLTGSFWKYYRSPVLSQRDTFGECTGDYSTAGALSYRQKVEHFFSQREFVEPNPANASRWKARTMDEVNRKWFYQHAEESFRHRSTQMLRRRATAAHGAVKIEQLELFAPEADPSVSYAHFLELMTGQGGSFSKLSALLDDSASRASCVEDMACGSFIHWSGLGAFGALSDAERQFLFLKSLLLMGGSGGGVLIDESEWFEFSQNFRAKAERMARMVSQNELRIRTEALFLAPHLWSSTGPVWRDLHEAAGPRARMIASLDRLPHEQDAKLLVVDPSVILTSSTIQRILNWGREGRVIVLPRNSIYTQAATLELAVLLNSEKTIAMDLGISYELYQHNGGKVILYETPSAQSAAAWKAFVRTLLSLAEIRGQIQQSAQATGGKDRLGMLSMERRGGGIGLFILNEEPRPVSSELEFNQEVTIADLVSLQKSTPEPASRFALEVPPFGILPVAVLDSVRKQQQSQTRPNTPNSEAPLWS